jgi:hypothetical protein
MASVQVFSIPAPSVQADLSLAPAQASPCLSLGSVDVSNRQVLLSVSNEALAGHVVFPVKQRLPLAANFQLRLEVVFKIRNPNKFQTCLSAINDPFSLYYERLRLPKIIQTP